MAPSWSRITTIVPLAREPRWLVASTYGPWQFPPPPPLEYEGQTGRGAVRDSPATELLPTLTFLETILHSCAFLERCVPLIFLWELRRPCFAYTVMYDDQTRTGSEPPLPRTT